MYFIIFKSAVNRAAADAQNPCGADLVATGICDRTANQLVHDLSHRTAQVNGEGTVRPGCRPNLRGQIANCQPRRFAENHGVLYCVLQLTDVSGPPVAGQRSKARVIDAGDLPAVLSVRSLNEVVD